METPKHIMKIINKRRGMNIIREVERREELALKTNLPYNTVRQIEMVKEYCATKPYIMDKFKLTEEQYSAFN